MEFIKNKKGVSDVITTVLIILLVLAAVAIIGGILLRNISQAGGKIETSTGCIELDLQPVSCNAILSASSETTRVLVQRGSRGSALQISKLNAAVQKSDGTTSSGSSVTIPAPLATATVDVTGTTAPRKSASVSATLQGSDGSQQVCELSNVKVDCNLGSGGKVNLNVIAGSGICPMSGTMPPGCTASSIATAGSGYSVGMVGTYPCTSGATPRNAILRVSAVNAAGGITGFTLDDAGNGCATIGTAYNF